MRFRSLFSIYEKRTEMSYKKRRQELQLRYRHTAVSRKRRKQYEATIGDPAQPDDDPGDTSGRGTGEDSGELALIPAAETKPAFG